MAAALLALCGGAGATTLENAQGAWVMAGTTKCSDTFKLVGKNFEFVDRDADAKGLDSGPVYAIEGDDEA